MYELYPDQLDLLERTSQAFKKHRAVVMCLATGGGKTVIAGHIMRRVHQRGGRALVVVHRDFLIKQFYKTLTQAGLAGDVGIIAAGYNEHSWKAHQIAMAQTLTKRIQKGRVGFEPTIIIIDEAHHAAAATWRRIIDRYPGAFVLGLTATPQREKGGGLDDIFEIIVYGLGISELIKKKRLAPYTAYSIPTDANIKNLKRSGSDYTRADVAEKILQGHAVADVAAVIKKHCLNRRWLAFAPSIDASKKLACKLRGSGLDCAHLDGDTSKPERARILADFADGKLAGLCVVDLISEGFDVPEADTAVLFRKTKSVVIYLQQVGRVLRYKENKEALILDCCGLIYDEAMGLPDAERVWSLRGRSGKVVPQDRDIPIVQCKSCGSWMPSTRRTCANCGAVRLVVSQKDTREVVDVELVKVELDGDVLTMKVDPQTGKRSFDQKAIWRKVFKIVNYARAHGYDDKQTIEALKRLGADVGYKPGWSRHAFAFARKRMSA